MKNFVRSKGLEIPQRLAGFTLVELLVVIAIIGMLVGLLLPAVQQAREAARQMQCANHLRNIAQACLTHESSLRTLPSGGWGWKWLGDPDRGSGWKQPGGLFYNILPFIEQTALHQLSHSSQSNLKENALLLTESPLSIYHCPSRRTAKCYPACEGWGGENVVGTAPISLTLRKNARCDYAENGGTVYLEESLDSIGMFLSSYTSANATEAKVTQKQRLYNGVFGQGGGFSLAEIRDGTSNTLLVGEKYLNPDAYETAANSGDDTAWCVGHDQDICRYASVVPCQDRAYYEQTVNFGSPHAGGFQTALCDGSIRKVSYSVELLQFQRLCNRNDGEILDFSTF
ncbi:MAG: DUF1559 domain-containing protein [Planctomycetia bacterium]|nr:DUF1559 domain-containing protein [Planctomycetia bacterium]